MVCQGVWFPSPSSSPVNLKPGPLHWAIFAKCRASFTVSSALATVPVVTIIQGFDGQDPLRFSRIPLPRGHPTPRWELEQSLMLTWHCFLLRLFFGMTGPASEQPGQWGYVSFYGSMVEHTHLGQWNANTCGVHGGGQGWKASWQLTTTRPKQLYSCRTASSFMAASFEQPGQGRAENGNNGVSHEHPRRLRGVLHCGCLQRGA